ncbi:unnamed protein product [Phytophthora fragariaefolia]|uniref:Unnamed protein product n=1 Tax=Phytophthora fragariaefolia TaxID=1490495 RepID=A0A9W6Y556_9STRA|nr:unnamed protein product [Phytophthora fragariaefolia]
MCPTAVRHGQWVRFCGVGRTPVAYPSGNKNAAAETTTLRRFAVELIYWDCDLKLVELVVQLLRMTRDDGTDSLIGTMPLFTPILPPMIHSVSHEALVQWKKGRRDYENKMLSRCRFQLNVESVNDTDGILRAEIEHIVGSVKNETLPNIKELFMRELKMDKAESDVNAQLIEYFKNFSSIVEDKGLTERFAGTNGSREKCKRLVSNLWPKLLKAEVKQCLRFTHQYATGDPRARFWLVLGKGNELERQHECLCLLKHDSGSPEKGKSKTQKNTKPKGRWEEKPSAKQTAVSLSSSSEPPSRSEKPTNPSSSTRPPPGPFPKCKEQHWLKDCPVASQKDKEEFWAKMKEAHKKKAKLMRLGELLHHRK